MSSPQTSRSWCSRSSFGQLQTLLRWLLVENGGFDTFTALMLVGELSLGLLIIRFVPYTEIDWNAYMQQVAGFLSGERDYSKLEGDTGPLVYPGLHLYIHTALSYLPTDVTARNPLLAPQLTLLALYLAQFWLTSRIYKASGIPQLYMLPLALSKRAHSIYMLRLFGDPWAVAIVTASTMFGFQKQRWVVGSVLFSLALGVKMNVLLYLPGLLLIFWKAIGIYGLVQNIAIILAIQLLLPAPYFILPLNSNLAMKYFTSSFDLSRIFLYKWTVNWRFVSEVTFLSREFHTLLLLGQIGTLVIFALACWCRNDKGGVLGTLQNGVLNWWKGAVHYTLSPREISTIMFTSNLIGIIFARSLHYQFQSWYFWQVPFLLYITPYPLILQLVIWLATEYGWLTYPSTKLSSSLLLAGNVMLLLGLFVGTPRRLEAIRQENKKVKDE